MISFSVLYNVIIIFSIQYNTLHWGVVTGMGSIEVPQAHFWESVVKFVPVCYAKDSLLKWIDSLFPLPICLQLQH